MNRVEVLEALENARALVREASFELTRRRKMASALAELLDRTEGQMELSAADSAEAIIWM